MPRFSEEECNDSFNSFSNQYFNCPDHKYAEANVFKFLGRPVIVASPKAVLVDFLKVLQKCTLVSLQEASPLIKVRALLSKECSAVH